jgi:hypothetical protein
MFLLRIRNLHPAHGLIAFLLLGSNPPCQGQEHRVFSYLLDPREHPDYNRRAVKPPSWDTFKNRTQFTCLRGFDVQGERIVGYDQELEKFTRTYELGNVIWPSYSILFATNLVDLADEIKHRDLYLFDIWGYVPGSGPGGYWQQFKPASEVFAMLESRLGERWLGTDVGEQDGRYIGGYASQMTPASADRVDQYLNFQRHFERMDEDLGPKHATLVSLNFGHYLLKEGTYTMIGAETAQALPNNQVYYAFIRGAGKQNGVPWFGNASIFNRWGFKTYGSSGKSDGYDHGPTKGTSLSLLKRLLYTHILYNCVAVGFENGWFEGDELSPIGRIQQSAQRWIREHGQPGVIHAPVALLLDFFSGWSFPRHLYSDNLYRVWGNLPYTDGDYLTDGILDLLYPGYQNSSYFHDESGFIAPTPYGDIADCILSDAPGWLLDRYPLVVVAGELRGGAEIRNKLTTYVEQGGHLILTSGNLANVQGLFGITNLSATFRTNIGSGLLTILSSGFGVEPVSGIAIHSDVDRALVKPYRLVPEVRTALAAAFQEQQLFNVGNTELSFVTTRKNQGEYLIGLANNSWNESPFKITSHCGQIESITELSLDQSEKGAPGYLPDGVSTNQLGHSGTNTIAGGDIRIFAIKLVESGVSEIPLVPPPDRPKGRFLPLRKCRSIQEAILSRPTFFQHFDGVAVSWEYFFNRERHSLRNEAEWLARQGVRIAVDASDGLNLYPTLRLIDNLPADYQASRAALGEVIEKMKILGATDLMVSLHRYPENNFSDEQTLNGFEKTFRYLAEQAKRNGVTLHLRQTFGKPPWGLAEAGQLLDRWKLSNLRLAADTSLLPGRKPSAEEASLLRRHLGVWLVAGSRNDSTGKLWDSHLPLHKATRLTTIMDWLALSPDLPIALDGLYASEDDEFSDIAELEKTIKQ